MKILHRNKNVVNIGLFSKADYSVLDYEQLLSVNGAGGSSGSGGGGPSGPTGSSSTTSGYGSCGGGTNSSGSNLSDRGYPSSTEGYNPSAPSDITVNPRYTEQRYFSDTYGKNFGEHACAATSLLNEISEQYTRETGHAISAQQVDAAMAAAVNSGTISSTNAWVSDWSGAANAMAQAVGLEGSYTYKN